MSTKPVHDASISCSTCRHWWTPSGTCHRHAPRPAMLATMHGKEEWVLGTKVYFPQTGGMYWCGDHEPVNPESNREDVA